MKESVVAALKSLIEMLEYFMHATSYDIIKVFVQGLSAGVDGRGLIRALEKIRSCEIFGEAVSESALWCINVIDGMSSRERKLVDRCLITLIDNPPETNLGQLLDSLNIQHMPVWMISACAGDRPPSLTQLLAWIHIIGIQGFMSETLLKLLINWHQNRRPQDPAEDPGNVQEED